MICKQLDCSKARIQGQEYCRKHFIEFKESIWTDNSNLEDMGIIKWLAETYPEHFRNSFPKEHLETYSMLLELYDPRYLNKMQRFRELIAFRDFAKSKIIFGFMSYIIAHNGMKVRIKSLDGLVQEVVIKERLMVIFSETGGMAEDFVVNIRDEFTTNPMLRYYYNFIIEDAMDAIDRQWTRRIFKINNTFVMGLGEGQQARGRVKGAYRITFAFYDDIYSENNTLTIDGRLKIKNWFYNSAQHTLDDLEGKAFLVGTIVHDDTVVVECENSKTWRVLKYTPMPPESFYKLIREHLKVDLDKNICNLPFEEEEAEFVRIELQNEYFQKLLTEFDWQLTWVDRIDLYHIALKYKEAVENQAISGFYQEYFHIVIPSEKKKFRREYFQELGEWSVTREYGYNWFWCEKLYGKEPKHINLGIGVDVAGGSNEGDDTCISLGGLLPDGRGVVLMQHFGKYSMRDNLMNDSSEYLRQDRIITDRHYVKKIGYIDEVFRINLEYRVSIIKIGQGGGSEGQIVNEFKRVFMVNNNYTQIYPRLQATKSGHKVERISETLLPKYETMAMFHANGLEKLEYQLEFLGKAKNDDEADSEEVLFFNLTRPENIDYKLFSQPVTETKRKSMIPNRGIQTQDIDWWRTN